MARWAGWGAGPAGAGAAGASRVFLALSLAGCVAVTAFLAKEGNVASAVVSGLAAAYFALRLFAGLGKGSR